MTTLHGLLAYPALKSSQEEAVIFADRALARLRLLKLLMASKNHATIRADLVVRIGIHDPSSQQRKTFNAVVRQMEAEGLIQRCLLRRPLHNNREHKEHCWMATPKGIEYYGSLMASSQQNEIRSSRLALSREVAASRSRLCLEPSFGRQLLESVQECGELGTTIDSINANMGGNLDRKRDLDHMLSSLRKASNPHYHDFTIFSALEQSGRIRNQRFWTRSCRPERLAPNESKEVDPSLLNAWIGLPDEESFGTVEEWRNRGPRRGEASLKHGKEKRTKKEQSDPDAQGPAKKARLRTKEENGEAADTDMQTPQPPPRLGRPRKNFDERAEKVAEKYRQRKEAQAKEAEENRRVERLVGETEQGQLNGSAAESDMDVGIGRSADNGQVETGEVKLGRPRTHFTPQAERAAQRYREKKAALEKAKREQRRAEGLPSEEETPFRALWGSRSLSSRDGGSRANAVGVSTAVGGEIGMPKQGDTAHLDPTLRPVPPQEGPRSMLSKRARGPVLDNYQPSLSSDRKASMNLTVQIKYETIQLFFREVQVVESSLFDSEYKRFVRRRVGAQDNTQQYDMDRKLRTKLFSSLERAGEIKMSKVAFKRSQRVIWYWTGIDEAKLAEYSRKVVEGKTAPTRLAESALGKNQRILDSGQVDAPDIFFQQVGKSFDFDVQDLDDFLGREKNRNEMLKYKTIRAQYTGRIPGLGARLAYFHKTVVALLIDGGAGAYGRGEWDLDLMWWTRRAKLGQYLKLVMPPVDEATLDASQDGESVNQAMENVNDEVRASLDVKQGGQGCYDTLKPLLDCLMLLGLAFPAATAEEGQLVYHFASQGSSIGWRDSLEVESLKEPVEFSSPQLIERYWQLVMSHCLRMRPIEQTEGAEPAVLDVQDSLRKQSAWYHNYHLLKPQQAYLYKTISLGLGSDVLSNDARLEQISRASLTPVWILRRYYERRFSVKTSKGAATKREVDRESGGRPDVDGSVVHSHGLGLDHGLSVQQANKIKRKARRVQEERLAEFDEAIRAYFEESTMDDMSRDLIVQGLATARKEYGRGEGGLTLKRVQHIFDDVVRSHVSGQATYSSVVKLKGGMARAAKGGPGESAKEKTKEKGKDGTRARKTVVDWTRARDELLRDGVVILRCRDRQRNPLNPRKNWAALDQIFPDINPSSRHQRFEHLRKAVGEEAYLNQLGIEWQKLWLTFRGTERLDDPNPSDPTDFDLMEHITFLRTHIDKLEVADKVDNETGDPLPFDGSLLLGVFDYERPPQLGYDYCSTLARSAMGDVSAEDKSKLLRHHPLTVASGAMGIFSAVDYQNEKTTKRQRALAIGLVKMVLCTSEADYSEEVATSLCVDNAAEDDIDEALLELQRMRIIKRKAKEGRTLPNRNFTYSDEYQQFFEDSLETLPFWQVASSMQTVLQRKHVDAFGDNDDGEVAASLMLLSRDCVKVDIGLNGLERIKMDKLFNAKNLNDDQLELPVQLRLRPATVKLQSAFVKKWTSVRTLQPRRAAVLQWCDDSVTTLAARCQQSWEQWSAKLGREKYVEAVNVKALLDDAGPNGIARKDIVAQGNLRHAQAIVDDLLTAVPPLAFAASYDDCRGIVAARFIPQWTVSTVSQGAVFPHKWYDIHGKWNNDVWAQSLQLVVHAIVTQPAITFAQLLTQFRLVLDRSELACLLDAACEAGLASKMLSNDERVRGQDAEWRASNDREIAFMARWNDLT